MCTIFKRCRVFFYQKGVMVNCRYNCKDFYAFLVRKFKCFKINRLLNFESLSDLSEVWPFFPFSMKCEVYLKKKKINFCFTCKKFKYSWLSICGYNCKMNGQNLKHIQFLHVIIRNRQLRSIL